MTLDQPDPPVRCHDSAAAPEVAAPFDTGEFSRTLLNHYPDRVCFKDLQSRYVRVSRSKARHTLQQISPDVRERLARLRGVASAALEPEIDLLAGLTDFDLFPGAQARPAFEVEQTIIRTGQPVMEQLERQVHADGQITWMEVSKLPWHDHAGNLIGTFGIAKDVTALHESEAKQAVSSGLLQLLLDSSPDCIYFKDLESRFVCASRAVAAQYFIADADALIGKSDFDFYTEEQARIYFEAEQQIIQTGEPIIGRMQKETYADGHVTWSLTSKMPWRDKAGRIVGTFGIGKDVTAIKKAEAEIERVNKQLRDVSRQAGMSEVATSVLHNVGNVLNSINVSVSVLSQHLRDPQVGKIAKVADLLEQNRAHLIEFLSADNRAEQIATFLRTMAQHLTKEQAATLAELELVTKNVEHIKEIVAMQQSYAKISGVAETVRPADLVEDALRMHLGALLRHDVHFTREFDPGTPAILVEKHKVLQILVNLIRNAKYACDEGAQPDKRMSVRISHDAQWVSIAVADNGVGIPAENLKKIFNHGFTTRKNGHGFGLHSAVLTATELGGSLRVHSAGPGRGATFTLELPLAPAASAS